MKIQDIPQVGKYGLSVNWEGRNGLIRRIYKTPKNPRTPKQLDVRGELAKHTRHFGTLTDTQQDLWNTAALALRSNPTLGESGPLTGLQLFVKVNCKLGLLGLDSVDAPPAVPEFPDIAPENLVITNTAGVIAVKLTCPNAPAENTVVRASPPQGPATRHCHNYRIIGVCPNPVGGSADITGLYTAAFGGTPVGKRIFVRVSTMVSGFESVPREFHARVPVAG